MQRPETAFLAPVVTFFGTVKPYKGVQQLINVAAVWPEERIETHGKWDRSLDDLQRLADLLLDAHTTTFPNRSEAAIRQAINLHRLKICEFAERYLSIVRQLSD